MFGQFVDMMNSNHIKNRAVDNINNDDLIFVDTPYYSVVDEKLNDKAFHELRPGQHSSMRTFLIDKNGKEKKSKFRLYSANPKIKPDSRKNSFISDDKICLNLKADRSTQNWYTSSTKQNSTFMNLSKRTQRSLFSKENLKTLHKEYQYKRLGPDRYKALGTVLIILEN